MRTCDTPRSAHQPNDLTLFHHIPNLHINLGLMPEAAVHSPAVVNDRCIAAHRPRTCKYHLSRAGAVMWQTISAAKIKTCMKSLES